MAAEDPEMAWHFWVRHYRNETQAKRDSKFTYLLDDGSWYTGLDPPEGAEPYLCPDGFFGGRRLTFA